MATMEQLERALRNADAAGDADAARALAAEIARRRGSERSTPAPPQPAAGLPMGRSDIGDRWGGDDTRPTASGLMSGEESLSKSPTMTDRLMAEQPMRRQSLFRGLRDAVEGPVQIGAQLQERAGILPEGSADKVNAEIERDRQEYELSEASQLPGSGTRRFIGAAAPYSLVPGGRAGGVFSRMATGGLSGGLIGGLQYEPEGGSRLGATTRGLIGGAAFPGLFSAVGAARRLGPLFGRKTPELAEKYAGSSVTPKAKESLNAARQLDPDFRLSPAEAADDPILAQAQGRLGRTEAGARRMLEAGYERKGREQKIIDRFFDSLADDNNSAAPAIRQAARKILGKQKAALQEASGPLYKKAFQKTIDDQVMAGLMDDPVIADSYGKVLRNPVFQRELKKYPKNSLRAFHLVKEDIDKQISTLVKREGVSRDSELVRGLVEAKRGLTDQLDNISPEYAAGRALFSDGARPVQELRESTVGKVASMSERQLKNVSKTIFDRQEVNPKAMDEMRKMFLKEDPAAWRRLVRNEMERRLDAVKGGGRTGSDFYNQILSREKDFNMFMEATKGMPDARRKLGFMRIAFKNLIEPDSVKGAAGKSEIPTSFHEALGNWAKDVLGGKYDDTAVDLVTNPRWDDELTEIMARKQTAQQVEGLMNLFRKAFATQQYKGLAESTAESAMPIY